MTRAAPVVSIVPLWIALCALSACGSSGKPAGDDDDDRDGGDDDPTAVSAGDNDDVDDDDDNDGAPAACESDKDCRGQVCDADRGLCVDCVEHADCHGGEYCDNHHCVTMAFDDDLTDDDATDDDMADDDMADDDMADDDLTDDDATDDDLTDDDATDDDMADDDMADDDMTDDDMADDDMADDDDLTGDPCSDAAILGSGAGCEFWAVALSNDQVDPAFNTDFGLVIINADAAAAADVSVRDVTGEVTALSIAPRGSQRVVLPWNPLHATVTEGELVTAVSARAPAAYRVTATRPVTAYQFNPLDAKLGDTAQPCVDVFGLSTTTTCAYSNDASLLLPAHALDTKYVAISHPHTALTLTTGGSLDSPGIAAIVATAPGTTQVQVTFHGDAAAGEKQAFLLEQYDVLQFASRANQWSACGTRPAGESFSQMCTYAQGDLTGSTIVSDQPVAVFGGADCAFAPFDKFACDHIEEQVPPVSRWGTRAFGVRSYPIGDGQAPDTWRVVAAADGTQLTFDPPPPPFVGQSETIDAGETLTFESTGDAFEVSSQDAAHPILLAQVLPGEEAAGFTSGTAAGVGDPSLIIAPAVTQYADEYFFAVPESFPENYVNITRAAGASVRVDGLEPETAWTAAGTGTHEWARLPIGGGVHRLNCAGGCGLVVYGYDEYVSYGYPGGLNLKPLSAGN